MRPTLALPTIILLLTASLPRVASSARPASGAPLPPEAPKARPADGVITLPAAAVGPLRALGEVAFYTSAARPVRRLAEITVADKEVATADLGLARGLMGLLRAGGVKLAGGAHGVARLTSVHHLGTIFRGPGAVRLLVMRQRPGGVEAALLAKAGGLPVVFRDAGGVALGAAPPVPSSTAAAAAGPAAAAAGAPPTSFGPLVRSSLAATARTRIFSPEEIRRPQLKAGPGKKLLVVHIARDFGAGLGQVSFLFGSGIILEPDFSPLKVVAGGRRFPPAGSYPEGPTLELVYEIPAAARDLRLEDGAASWPLTPEAASPARAGL